MKHRGWLKSLLGLAALVGIAALLVWAFEEGRAELAREREREQPVKPAWRVSLQDGEYLVALDEASQERSGLAVAQLEAVSHRQEVRAYGSAVDLQVLVEGRHRYVAARAEVEKARAGLELARQAHQRLGALHADDRNISEKTLQEAEATLRAQEAATAAAQGNLQAVEDAVRAQWGEVLAQWVFEGGAAFSRLLHQREVLLQLTLPPQAQIAELPQAVSVQALDGALVPARLVSPAPRTDPRIQGRSFFCLAPPETGLLPSMNAVGYLPWGPPLQGVMVPAAAVVWWQGRAWTYLQKDREHFVRREVPSEIPVEGGWFASRGLGPGDRLVVSGAQQLLSEEFRAQIQPLGEEGGEE